MKFNRYSKLLAPFIGFLFLIVHCNTAMAQYKDGKTGNGIMPNITPVSPEASSLGKYGDWPVSLYTGTVNIAVPIYNIKVGNFELPIQLSYHTGGVKVDEVPSWCGTSWTLAAGGAITRSTVGMPDEEPNGFLSRNLRNDTLKTTTSSNDPYNLSNPNDYVFLKKITDQAIDSEPDLFFYNFAGQSGKFYFDKLGNFQSIPVNSLKVVKSPIKDFPISYWEIADQEGNLFYFGSGNDGVQNQGIEFSTTRTITAGGDIKVELEQPTAWYLTKIIIANSGEVINFDYLDKAESYKLAPVYSYRQFVSDNTNQNYLVKTLIPNYNSNLKLGQVLKSGIPNTVATYLPNTVYITGKSRLNKISWSSGSIVFEADLDRQDIMGKNLSKVTLYDKSLNTIKQNKFYYSYINERYYLDSLQELGSDLVRKSAHSFEYESPNLLPAKFSNAQDHWGYFNAAYSNAHLLPTDPSFPDPNVNANRESNESTMGYGTLKKITYPTGGSSQFQYEGNRYDSQDIPGGGNPIQTIVATSSTVKATDPQASGFQRVQNLNIDFIQNNTTISLRFKNYAKPPSKRAGVLPLVKLERKLADGSYVLVGSWDAFDNFPVNPVRNSNNLYDFDVIKTVNLIAAEYRLVADLLPEQFGLGDPLPIMPEITTTINYQVYQMGLPAQASLLGGGLRIKTISNFSNGNLVNRNQYNYPTGKLLIYPKYTHEYGEDVKDFIPKDPNQEPAVNCFYLIAKYKETISSGQAVLGFTQGAPVGYQNIEERSISPEGLDNGYTAYQYSFVPDVLNEFHFNGSYWVEQNVMNRTVPLNNNEYKRGLLITKDIYQRKATGEFVKMHNLTNHYEFNDGNFANRYNSLRAMRVKRMITVNYSCGTLNDGVIIPQDDYSANFAYSYYNIFTGWVQNKYTSETTYDQNGQNPIDIRTDYTYDNPQHLQVTKTTKSSSDGNIKVQQVLYPHEMVANGRDAGGVYQAMIAKNIISPVIEESESLNGKINKHLTNYTQPYTGIFVPSSIETLNTTTGLNETRLSYHSYDQKGNPVSLSLEGGIKVNYVWSYGGQLLIAEIKNADYNQIQAVLGGFQAVNTLSSLINPTDAELNNAFNALRIGLPDAHISTYKYKPLVGMSSSTDAKGMTTYYEYDAFQRLKAIKDQDGNIIKANTYHYKN